LAGVIPAKPVLSAVEWVEGAGIYFLVIATEAMRSIAERRNLEKIVILNGAKPLALSAAEGEVERGSEESQPQ